MLARGTFPTWMSHGFNIAFLNKFERSMLIRFWEQDIIFLHDRGKYQTLYFAFYFGSLMVSNLKLLLNLLYLTSRRSALSYQVLWHNS
jgi:hypothetical protein